MQFKKRKTPNIIRISALLLCISINTLFLPLFISSAFAYTSIEELFGNRINSRITLDLQDATLRDTLKMLSVQSGLNFVASEAVADRKITVYLNNIRLKDAMDKIFKVNNLTYDLDEESNIFIVKDWGIPTIEVITKVYFLKYAALLGASQKAHLNESGMLQALNKVISGYGKITEDPTTNSLIITDVPSKFPVIEQIIDQLDVATPQVMIQVEILDVDKSDVDKLGVKFSGENWISYTGPDFGQTYFPFVSDNFRKTGPKDAPEPADLTMAGFTFVVDFLKTRSSTKFLARPILFVMNNETAELKLTTNEGINTVTQTQASENSTTTSTNVERAETGVSLKVTPQISMATGEITMDIEPTVKEAVTGGLTVNSQVIKDVEERSVKSRIRVKDGNTVIIGGLIRQKEPRTLTGVPFLSNIPIVGMLFRHKYSGPRKDREILVFITPMIIKDSKDVAEGRVMESAISVKREQDNSFSIAERKEVISSALGAFDKEYK